MSPRRTRIIIFCLLFVTFLHYSPPALAATSALDLTDLNLSTIQSITVTTSYDKAHAIGLDPGNYEYSAHLIKQSSPPYYQMIYGGRCYFDSNRQCQTRDSSGNWPKPNGGGDGDHLKYAESNDGINWNAQDYIPVIYQGKEEGNPFLPEQQNRMDPTIIKWGNLYYMYYQLQIDPTNGCTDATCDSLTDSITYATSSDLKTWTKSNRLIILNKSKTEAVVHPKAIKVGNEIWLYLSWYDASGWRGMYLIKSTDPTNFDFNQKIANTGDWGYTDGSQHLVLFPNDPANRLHLAIGYQDGTNNNTIPLLVFSHDGIHWVKKSGGFPATLNNLSNIFCNIATDENSSLTPNSPGGNDFSSVYSCATFNGANSNAGFSDLSSGGFEFTINYKTAAIPDDLVKSGDINGDGREDQIKFSADGVSDGISIALSTGSGFSSVSRWSTDFDDSHGWNSTHPRMVSDVNDDGKADIIGFGVDGVYVGLSTGTSFSPVSRWTTDLDDSHGWDSNHPRMLGDVNGDGKADIIGFGADGVYVGLSTGTSFSPVSRWTTDLDDSHGWNTTHPRKVGDVNGDGKKDLVGYGIDGVYVALSTGSSFSPISRWSTDFDASHGWDAQRPQIVGDVNGDGKADIVGFGVDGVYVGLSTGTNFSPVSRWTTDFDDSHGWNATHPRMVSDVNNDGKADLVGVGVNGTYVALSTGTGFSPITLWTNPTPTALPGDLNVDGHVDIFDYNLLVSNFGNPYTIFDYNNLIANYGK